MDEVRSRVGVAVSTPVAARAALAALAPHVSAVLAQAASGMSVDVAAVQALARRWHGTQVDKSGVSYVDGHVARVAAEVAFLGPLVEQVAWLHDVVEDAAVSVEDLRIAGVHPQTVASVAVLTHPRHEPLQVYWGRVRSDPVALAVKLADVADNSDPGRLALLDVVTRERLTVKYQRAVAVLAAPFPAV